MNSIYIEGAENVYSTADNNFYEKYNPTRAIVTNILKYTNRAQEIDECVNSVYASLTEKLQQYNEMRGSMTAFVIIIARCAALDFRRSGNGNTSEQSGEENINVMAEPVSLEKEVECKVFLENMVQKKLTAQERRLYTMKYVLYDPPEEIAKCFDIERNAVDARVHRLKDKIRNLLKKGGMDESQKSSTDMMSEELLAKMIDETLSFKKAAKNGSMRSLLFKIIPAAAAIALVIGLLNMLPYISGIGGKTDPGSDLNAGVETAADDAPTPKYVDQSDLFLPQAIEKTFFEDKIMFRIADQRGVNRLSAYYKFDGSVYTLDPNTSAWEQNELLGYLREYTDLSGYDMYKMCVDNDITLPKKVDPAYAHVRFGETENILLLDVEWHTYETYVEETLESVKKWYNEYIASDEFMEKSDKAKEGFHTYYLKRVEEVEKYADAIRNEISSCSRTINGKSTQARGIQIGYDMVNMAKSIDSDGYYIYKVFPINWWFVGYFDENYERHFETFAYGKDNYGNSIGINSESEYEYVLENEIIPFCDDLLAKGLISQEEYDLYTPPNLLDYYIDLLFN